MQVEPGPPPLGRSGLIQQADGGTLFLDEVDSLPFEVQAKLLRVVETGEVRPLDARAKRRVQVRLLSAAQPELRVAVQTGRFRLDLLQRLAGAVIELPPLAERPEDVLPLAEHFAARGGRVLECGVEAVLVNYSWPGNVRELKLTIERAGLAVANGTLPPSAIAEAIALGGSSATMAPEAISGSGTLTRPEVVEALRGARWDVVKAAAILGMGRTKLFTELKRLGVSVRVERVRERSPRSPQSAYDGERAN